MNKIKSLANKPRKSGITKSNRDILVKQSINIKNFLPPFLILFSIIFVISLVAYFSSNHSQSKKGKLACATANRQLLTEASSYLVPNQSKNLKLVVDKIKALPNYQEDPNCLNIVVTYYINISDSKNARDNMNRLVVVYDPKAGFVPELGLAGGKNIDQLRAGVEFIEKLDAELKKNMFYGPAV